MQARRQVAAALKSADAESLKRARAEVDATKHDLGERGAVWWSDGTPDLNRHMARNTVYAGWYAAIDEGDASRMAPGLNMEGPVPEEGGAALKKPAS
jgi:hypothetical protein